MISLYPVVDVVLERSANGYK